jgi:hypothetical protein
MTAEQRYFITTAVPAILRPHREATPRPLQTRVNSVPLGPELPLIDDDLSRSQSNETTRALRSRLWALGLNHAWHGPRAAFGYGQPWRDLRASEIRTGSNLRPAARLRLSPAARPVPILERCGTTAWLNGEARRDQQRLLSVHGVASLRAMAGGAD